MTRGENGETIASGTIEVSYDIRAWDRSGSTVYDWISDTGESNELFETIEEAVISAKQSLGG